MSSYDYLKGQLFTRDGVKYMVIKVHDATVVAAHRASDGVRRVLVPLADVLGSLDYQDEIEVALPAAEDA